MRGLMKSYAGAAALAVALSASPAAAQETNLVY